MHWLIRLALYGRGLLLWGAWLLYMLSPVDFLPDFLPYVGRLDDLLAAIGVWWMGRRLYQQYRGHFTQTGSGGAGYQSHTSHGRQASSEATSSGWDPWKILQIAPGATAAEIDTAYKQLLMQYHPDRVAHLGEELQQLASRKTLDIQKAYSQLRPRKAR